MNVVFSLILLAAALGCIVFLLTRRENARRSQYGPSGLSEFRTDLPLDDCFDRLDQHSTEDELPSSRWTPCIPSGLTPGGRPSPP